MKRHVAIAVIMLPILGAALGRLAGPFMARAHFKVKLAARIWAEDSQQLEDRTLETEAFRAKPRSKAKLYEEARGIERTFRIGGALFGLWCGLAAAAKIFAAARGHRGDLYDINHAACVCCTRCYATCPRERLRRGEIVLSEGAESVQPPEADLPRITNHWPPVPHRHE